MPVGEVNTYKEGKKTKKRQQGLNVSEAPRRLCHRGHHVSYLSAVHVTPIDAGRAGPPDTVMREEIEKVNIYKNGNSLEELPRD